VPDELKRDSWLVETYASLTMVFVVFASLITVKLKRSTLLEFDLLRKNRRCMMSKELRELRTYGKAIRFLCYRQIRLLSSSRIVGME